MVDTKKRKKPEEAPAAGSGVAKKRKGTQEEAVKVGKKSASAASSLALFKVYVGNLKCPVDQEALRKKFATYGAISDLTLPASTKEAAKCFAFISYATEEAAKAACEAAGSEFGGAALKVQLSGEKGGDSAATDTTVFVAGLPPACKEGGLRKHFAPCGEITKLEIPPCKAGGKHKGETRGIAFVTFSTRKSHDAAVKLDGKAYEGSTLKIKEFVAKSKSEKPKKIDDKDVNRVFVGGIPKTGDEASLRSHFEACGAIKRCMMPINKDKSKRGVAFLNFVSPEGVKKAVKLDGSEYKGKPLKVTIAGAPSEAKGK